MNTLTKPIRFVDISCDDAIPPINPPLRDSNAITSYKKYGVTRSFIHSLALNQFKFPAQYRDCLSEYFLLEWKPEYFKSIQQDGAIKLHTGVKYLIVFQNCTPTGIANCKRDLLLSFRKCQPEFNVPAYVIVRLKPLETKIEVKIEIEET